MFTDYVNSMTTGIEQGNKKCGGPARLIVDGKKAKQLLARIVKNQRSVYEPKVRYNFGAVAA
jgi:hypothetical protein